MISTHILFYILSVSLTYPESFWEDWYLHQAHQAHHDWCQVGKFSKFLPSYALKMLAPSVLDFFGKHFPNYLHYKTLLFMDDV